MTRLVAGISLAFCLIWLFQGCHQDTAEDLKQKIVGNWREVCTRSEYLNFPANGTVQMHRPTINDTCEYDFPDAEHLRLTCAPQSAPPRPQVLKVQFKAASSSSSF